MSKKYSENGTSSLQSRITRHVFLLILLGIIIVTGGIGYGAYSFFHNTPRVFAQAANNEERAQLEAELAKLEKEISENEATVAKYRAQGNTLSSEIKALNANIAKLTLQTKAITLTLSKLDKDIKTTQSKITTTQGEIDQQQETLADVLQQIYESNQRNTIEMLLTNLKFSDFFLDVNNLLVVKDTLRETLEKVVALKNDLMDHKEALAAQYEDNEQLRKEQEAQRALKQKTEAEKKNLLQVTKGQESKYQQIVAEKKKTAAEIRNRLYKFIGGGQLSFGEAYRLAQIASDGTGVRTALILAVLDNESALGKNVGKCKYDSNPYYPAQATNKTTMHPTRDIPPFLEITKSLGIDPSAVFVSCPIPRDGAYGGAMGPAQFIPSTWVGYSDRISAITGNRPANPWNNEDAFTATALYLKSAGGVGSLYNEKVAAAKYYAGGNWRTYMNTYGSRVVNKAEQFEKDIQVLKNG